MILVFVETDDSGPVEASLETVTFVRDLVTRDTGELGGAPIHAVVVGSVPDGTLATLGAHGVSEVHHAVGEAFSAYGGAVWATAVATACRAAGATAVAASGTPRGGEIMAHVATRLGVAMAANVVGCPEPFLLTRQVSGGAVLEEMRLDERPAVFTVAGHAVEASPAAGPAAPTVREFAPEIADADLVARVVSSEPGAPDESGGLRSARVVVGAGRGAGSADGFDGVIELAELLGGTLGVSRVVTSLGWRPHHEQVGQTGSRISPELYIPCGISGAIQHWAGCASSKTILAINTDPDAPMVTRANYAVIGDMHQVVPAIITEIRRRAEG
jgi:electron transfer flavoprotein alpha subunit